MAERVWKTTLLSVMAIVLFTGCGQQGQTIKQETEEITLTAFVQQSVTTDSGVWKGWAADRLLEDTGITLEFYPTGSDVKNKLKQHMASGTIPDLIGFKGLDQAKLYMDAELLLALDDFRELLPAVFETPEYQQALAYSREYTGNGEGVLFLMPVEIGPAALGDEQWTPMLQWQPYQRAGAPKLSTLEDYLDVVEKMLQAKPLNDMGEKNYGFSLYRDWDEYSASEVASLSYFYGIDTQSVSPLMETDVVNETTRSLLRDDSFYKRALYFYFEANQRGLLDPDSQTQTYRNLEKKLSEGRVMFSWYNWLTGSYNAVDSGHVNNTRQPNGYVAIPAQDMKLYESPDQSAGKNWYFAINKKSRNVEKACALLNWLYDPEVQDFLYNGPEGVTWEINADGEPQLTEEGWHIIDNKSEDLMPDHGGAFEDGTAPFHTLGLRGTVCKADGWPLSHIYWKTSDKEETALELEVQRYYGGISLQAYLEKNNMLAPSTEAVNLVPALTGELQKKTEEIGEIVRKYSWEMIYAQDEEAFSELWKQMQELAAQAGMEEVELFYQDAWQKALLVAKGLKDSETGK